MDKHTLPENLADAQTRRQLLDLLSRELSLEEAAIEAGVDSVMIRFWLEHDKDLRTAIEKRRQRYAAEPACVARDLGLRFRQALEGALASGNASVINACTRQFLAPSITPLPRASDGHEDDEADERAQGESRAASGRSFAQTLKRYTPRDLARWFWLEIHAGTPEPASRLLPDHYPEDFEKALMQLASGLDAPVGLKQAALDEAERAFMTHRAGDRLLYPELAEKRLEIEGGLKDVRGHELQDVIGDVRRQRNGETVTEAGDGPGQTPGHGQSSGHGDHHDVSDGDVNDRADGHNTQADAAGGQPVFLPPPLTLVSSSPEKTRPDNLPLPDV